MKFPLRIALRYLFSKKKTNIINILSLLSVIGVLLSTVALVIILSVFNGFEQQILAEYNPISPDIRITAKEGKRFVPDTVVLEKIKQIKGVEFVVPVIRERAVIAFKGKTVLATLLGISDKGQQIYNFETLMEAGDFYTHYNGSNFIVLGLPIAVQLRANLFAIEPLEIYAAQRGKRSLSQLNRAFKKERLRLAGVYNSNAKIKEEQAIVNYDFAKQIFSMGKSISAWEIKTEKGGDNVQIRDEIKELLGDKYVVKERYELNATLFRVVKIEKLFVFATLVIILLIAAFNVVGALSMMIIDKKEDIAVLKSMGVTQSIIQNIFVIESLFVSLLGAFGGVVLGLFISGLQWQFGFIRMPENYDSIPFPVLIKWEDIVLIIAVVLIIGFLVAFFTVRSIPKKLQIEHMH